MRNGKLKMVPPGWTEMNVNNFTFGMVPAEIAEENPQTAAEESSLRISAFPFLRFLRERLFALLSAIPLSANRSNPQISLYTAAGPGLRHSGQDR